MKTILIRLFTFIMLMVFSVGASADVKVLYGEKGTAKFEGTGGKIEVTQKESDDKTQVTVYLTVTPDNGYIMVKDGIEVYTVAPADISQTRAVTASTKLDIKCEDFKDEASKRTYTATIDANLALWLKSANFQPQKRDGAKAGENATPGYYAIHQNGKGYLRVNSANVTLTNDVNFHYGDLFDNNGNSIWYVTPSGYLQNGYFYLNVINGRTLCLSVEPKTIWQTEEITGDSHGKMHLKTGGLYLCNDNNTITLIESPTAYYNACPITITEKSWSGPSASDLTLQSPQQVTYLRAYYTQKMDYEFYNDAGTKVSATGKDRRVYAKLYYESGGSNKGTNWDINTTSGVIYNKLTSNVAVTATYRIEPADPIAFGLHSTPGTKSIKYTLQPKSITPVAGTNYLLFSIKAGDNDRYPYDDGIAEGGEVKPDGKGGTGTSSLLTDPANPVISWKLAVDEEGFYTFQNASTNKYLYYEEKPHDSSDYGALKLGSSPSDDNRYKFRLYKTSNTDYGVCYQIIPFSRQFAVYKNDGVATGFYTSLNNNNYKSQTTKVISLYKADDNSQWCIYKYEAEYRVKKDFSIKVETSATANATGAYLFSSEGWYAKCIKESPTTGNGQTGLVINGTYKNKNNINYQWTVTGIGDYISISDGNNTAGTNSDGTWTITTTGNDNIKKLKINVTALPPSTVSGLVKLRLSGGESPNVVTSANADEKTVAFTILGDGTVSFTPITSLSEINASNGVYQLSDAEGSNFAYSDTNKPTVTSFSGILDGNGQTITGLDAPLFSTLTNGTVRNVNLSGVSISSHSGPTGAIAGSANGGSRIYNVGILDGEVGSSNDVCGGLVGKLDGSARVINCFSYANITGGTDVGGIVGYNSYASKSGDIRTMVMNCMFYGDITAGTNVSPVFGGNNISNLTDNSDRAKDGLNTFNYYAYEKATTYNARTENATKKYNSALAVEEKYLNRFEFYRLLLNSNKKLAAFYATGSPDNADQKMLKWVLETADRSISGRDPYPYPILKAQGYYPSIINYDAEHAPNSASVGRNKGGKLGKTLSVTISEVGSNAPSGATITTGSLILQRTDKDFDRFNYNYDKVQLPYYNDVGTGNYTGNRVVTGWKITAIDAISGDPYTAANYPSTGVTDYPNHNYADRKSSNKDLYSVSGRVFSQGAYFDVPYGVTSITIEPYWGKACYIADEYYDVVYKADYSGKQGVSQTGTQVTVGTTKFYEQDVQKSIEPALNYIANSLGGLGSTVYDNALVLVGNLHLNVVPLNGDRPFTMMSVDADHDNEPDYSLIYHHIKRTNITPIRFDFLAVPGTAQAQKPNGASSICNFTIFKTRGWFEVTNTAFMYSSQIEYENGDLGNNVTKIDAPLILLGGIFDQFVSTQSSKVNGKTIYIHVGSNVWINSFGLGTHSDGGESTPHVPVSVTGGEYEGFYLTGTYKADAAVREDNAECYISGGYFHEAAGASLEQIDGNVHWQIYNADIDEFFGGGINDAKPITGDIEVDIFNSYVTTYCGGPKFGNMQPGKTVTTNAEGCTFGKYFGAGFGGTSLSSKKYYDQTSPAWGTTLQGYFTTDRGKYFDGITTNSRDGGTGNNQYGKKGPGVATDFDYESFVWSDGQTGGRFFVKFASFSLAQCNDVESILTNCTINGNFYGGGSLGKVVGTVTSELDGCTVKGNVFGAGYSASIPTLKVRDAGFTQVPKYNSSSGMFEPGTFSGTTEFTWRNISNAQEDGTTLTLVNGKIKNGTSGSNLTKNYIYTDIDLSKSNLGSVAGNVNLTIKGNSVIGTEGDATKGNVYGGGESSYVTGDHTVTVNLQGKTEVLGNVFGGGDSGVVEGSTVVNIE